MIVVNLDLKLKILGSVLDCIIKLEGKTIGLWGFDMTNNVYIKKLTNYPINGDLIDIEVTAKGKNGSSAKLSYKISNSSISIEDDIVCVVENGKNTNSLSIQTNHP